MIAPRIAIRLLLATFAHAASAQDATAWVDCDPGSRQVVVTYHPGDGNARFDGPYDHAVVFYSLLEVDPQESRVTATHEATVRCRLGDGEVSILLEPTIGNVNLLGACGGSIGGAATIARAGTKLVEALDLEPGFCAEAEGYVARVVVGPGDDDVVVERRRFEY